MKPARQPFSGVHYHESQLQIEGLEVAALAKCYEKLEGSPLWIYSRSALLEPLVALQKHLRALNPLICFAAKANSNPAILSLYAKAGAGVDLVSGGELKLSRAAGFSPGKMVFSGVGKTRDEIRAALKLGILSFNVESLPELRRIETLAKADQKIARIVLRFNPDVDAETHPHVSTGKHTNKFGMAHDELFEAATIAARSKSLQLLGASVHIGSQIQSLRPFRQLFKKLRPFLRELEQHVGHPLTHLDLGGGLGIAYRPGEKVVPIAEYARLIRAFFAQITRDLGHTPRLILEPGRLLCGNAGILVSEVQYRRPSRSRKQADLLIIDAGMNDLIRPALYGSHHEIVPLQIPAKAHLVATDVVGPVCESADTFAFKRKLPQSLNEGDRIALLSAGAYGFSMTSDYNSRGSAAEILVHGKQAKIIRPRHPRPSGRS